MFAGHVHKPFEILGRIAERYAVPAFLEGGGDLLAAFQGNFTLGRPAPANNSTFMERKLQLRRKDALNGFGMFPAAMDGGAGVFAFSIADKQIFIALVERYHFVVAGPLVRINDEKNRMYEIFWQRPGPFDMVVDGLGDLVVASGIDHP